MGREIRRVPPHWEHPVNEYGNYQPMHDETFEQACAKWDADKAAWDRGERPDYGKDETCPFEEWNDERPDDSTYYRQWQDAEATWIQVWETVSEGSPTTPPFATEDELVDHLAAQGESLMPPRYREGPWSRDVAEKFVKNAKWAPTMIIAQGQIFTPKDGLPPLEN